MTMHLHRLKGCSPEPLAYYLKALGVLRLVGEQADHEARGWWQDEQFCLLTRLSRNELEAFFLEKYQPTPLLSPWNKGCGFFKAGDPGLAPLERSKAARFEQFRVGIAASRQLLDAAEKSDAVIRAIKARTKTNRTFQTEAQRKLLASSESFRSVLDQLRAQAKKPDLSSTRRSELSEDIAMIENLVAKTDTPPTKPEADRLKASSGYKRLLAAAERRYKSLKATLIPDCSRAWRGPHAEWLAAAVVLDEQGNPSWPSLLGTGGNDGNLDFTNNFMQQLGALLDVASADGRPTLIAAELLRSALWSAPASKLSTAAIGQYQPGAAGGANSSTGFDSGNMVNAWDFVLMLEGSIVFRSRATRRLDPNTFSRASAPFAVRSHAVGFASPGSEKAQRGEQWMPLWSRPALLSDVAALLGEARLQLGRQTANRPIDAARAISRLGVARGIESFTRYGYLERNGQSTLAVPLGRVKVRQHPRSYLIDDLAAWLDRLQRRARDKNAPARLVHAERQLADAVFAALTHDPDADRWQAILRAAVAIESLQATGTAIDAQPIPELRPEWASSEVVGDSPEVRLARALGSAAARFTPDRHPIDSIRHHWLSLEPGARRFKISDKRLVLDPRVVATGRDAAADCAAIVDRRLIEAGMKGQRRLPLVAAVGCGARLADLSELLAGAVDLDRTVELARAFMAIKWSKWQAQKLHDRFSPAEFPDAAWLTLRLSCLPWDLDKGLHIPAEPNLVRRLTAGDGGGAVEIARRRLRSAGLRVPLQAGVTDPATAQLWAAALVFPIEHGSAWRAVRTLDPSKKGTLHV
ncbi:MAG TPA: type I-U CRISPR-associated protein Csx17 [Pirellulales bacterium]|jgi:CRISPR-associated protein Csx17|nr:type I-U CRISPR-associated protein Csx17 [Pirellulales bacterium]